MYRKAIEEKVKMKQRLDCNKDEKIGSSHRLNTVLSLNVALYIDICGLDILLSAL